MCCSSKLKSPCLNIVDCTASTGLYDACWRIAGFQFRPCSFSAAAQSHRRGRGRGNRSRGKINVRRDGPMKFEEDFDFETANAQFNKDEIDKELQNKLKLKGKMSFFSIYMSSKCRFPPVDETLIPATSWKTSTALICDQWTPEPKKTSSQPKENLWYRLLCSVESVMFYVSSDRPKHTECFFSRSSFFSAFLQPF